MTAADTTFTTTLREVADDVWAAIFDHPMVQGLGDDTLPEDRFRYWVKQDYLFLIDYSRVFAYGAVKAPDLDRMVRFATLLHETLTSEMDLHRTYAKRLGIPADELEQTVASPTTHAYTDFLVRTAAVGGFGDLVAAVLPCMWGFNATGQRLADGPRPATDAYAEWIDMYSGDDFTRLTTWCRDLMDEVAADAAAAQRERWTDIFRTSSRHELAFWDAAWRQEAWGV